MKNLFNRLMYGKSNKSDYTKEDLQGESRLKLFFDILGVKYMQLIKLNLLLVACALPLIIWSYMYFNISSSSTLQEVAANQVVYVTGLIPCLLILAAPLAGITYIIKNFTQDKHVWLWKDFVEHTKSNAKQAVLYMLVYSFALLIGQLVLYAYTSILLNDASNMISILRGVFLVIYILAGISIMYAFPMMVTYELKLKDIIRNSLLLTIGSLNTTFLGPVLALLPFAAFFVLATVWGAGTILLLLYSLVFGLAFGIYIIVSFTTAVFDKHLSRQNDAQEENTEQEN